MPGVAAHQLHVKYQMWDQRLLKKHIAQHHMLRPFILSFKKNVLSAEVVPSPGERTGRAWLLGEILLGTKGGVLGL